MTAARAERAGNVLLVVLIVVVMLAECLLALLGATAWEGGRDGSFTPENAMPFTVMGVSAVIGVVLALLALIALLRGRRGHGLARVTANLAWLRLGGVILVLGIGALTYGVAVAAVFPAFGIVLALGDAAGGLIVAGAAVRRTRDG